MKKDLRIIKTEESLRKALLELLKTKTLETISISELCRLAQINRGTFYLHYKDIHGVFRHYFEVIVDDLRKAYEEPYLRTNFQLNRMSPDMIKIFSHVKKYQAFYQIVFEERIPMTYYYLIFDTLRKFMGESLEKNGEIDKNKDELKFHISYHTNAIIGILVEWNRESYQTEIEDLNALLIELVTTTVTFKEEKE
ncbi:TetR/AcrR family transcriptional regulator [Oceanobacillus sp. CAU 1775]